MADAQLIESLRSRLSDPAPLNGDAFSLLRGISDVANEGGSPDELQELILRALEHRSEFGQAEVILDALVREVGLYPYINVGNLWSRDLIAYEMHRPDNFGGDFVFHRPQAEVYRALLDGQSIALSAPMSFGKSVIIDAIIASGRYSNVVVVVPTIALIDETRRRLTERFRQTFKIITHPGQTRAERNILILTQERVLQMEEISPVDLFVIDEFYKLNPSGAQDDRAYLLNNAFYRLNKIAPQFYMLGPGVIGWSAPTQARIKCTFIAETYHTVVSELHRVAPDPDDMTALVRLCRNLEDPTIIYCSSPQRASDAARALIDGGVGNQEPTMVAAAEWIAEQYHTEWHFGKGLVQSIGVHHGRIPRSLGQFVIRQFNEEHLRFLVCTSTLIEGINTKARNIVILDNRIGRTQIDRFTFNNIRGRAGRMGQHFIGHVYIFHEPPRDDLPLIDVPAISQVEGTPPSLLIQLDDEDLEDHSRKELEQYLNQGILSAETIRKSIGVDVEAQLNLALKLQNDAAQLNKVLAWERFPTYEQLQGVCELIWENFGGAVLGAGSVRSARQLTFLIWKLSERPQVSELIADQMRFANSTPDDAVAGVLDFLRLWATFNFPRLLRTLDNIQNEIFTRLDLPVGDYSQYATVVENLFTDPALIALDEYGLPLEVARKLEARLNPDGDLDVVLERLRQLDVQALGLPEFERTLLLDTIAAL